MSDHKASLLAVATGEKPCKGCGQVLPLSDFPPSKQSPHIGNSRCWDCQRAQRRAYYRKDAVKIRQAVRLYRDAHRETYVQRSRQWYAENRERAIRDQYVHKVRRRARQVGAECGCVTEPLLRSMAELLDNQCVYCGAPFEHWDHAIPLSLGGLHCIDNIVPACAACNLSKHAQTQEQFMARTGLIQN